MNDKTPEKTEESRQKRSSALKVLGLILAAVIAVGIVVAAIFLPMRETHPVLSDDIKITPPYLDLDPGQSEKLTCTLPADEPEDTTVLWSSSDESVAVVDDTGMVTGVADGVAIITAEAGGYSAIIRVVVTEYIRAEEKPLVGSWNGVYMRIGDDEAYLSPGDVPMTLFDDKTGITSIGSDANTLIEFNWEYLSTNEEGKHFYSVMTDGGTEMQMMYMPEDDQLMLILPEGQAILYERS